MKTHLFLQIVGTLFVCWTSSLSANRAYVSNQGSGTVSVIATASNIVTDTITVGDSPVFLAITPEGSKAYVSNLGSDNVSVINTASNTVAATIAVEVNPYFVAITPDGSKAYVSNQDSNNVSVIDTASDAVTSTITVGLIPLFVAITPDGSKAYISNLGSSNVSVIDTASNIVTATITVGDSPYSIAITPDPLPPAGLSGKQKKNVGALQETRTNILTWTAPTSGRTPMQYKIYRNAALTDLAGTVPANSPLMFLDPSRKKNTVYTYFLVTVSATDDVSAPVSITVKPR